MTGLTKQKMESALIDMFDDVDMTTANQVQKALAEIKPSNMVDTMRRVQALSRKIGADHMTRLIKCLDCDDATLGEVKHLLQQISEEIY